MIDINERPPAPRPVIFDIDGTLVDSNDAHAHAWVDALAEAGHDVAFGRVRPLIGMGGDKVLPELVGLDEDSPEGKRIAKRRGEIFRTRYFPAVRGLPGAQALVSLLVREGHALAVASSARKEELQDLLRLRWRRSPHQPAHIVERHRRLEARSRCRSGRAEAAWS